MTAFPSKFGFILSAVPPGATVSEQPMTLDREMQEEVDRRLEDIAACRAQAWVSARSYVLHGV